MNLLPTPSTPMDDQTETPHETDLTPLLMAWDVSHPATDPDWRHLLDEMANPDTTRAFHHLAETAA
ncbi:hypothetical protein AB5J55_20265 [Streptomyces sp. R11]|uniref:Uncharacterized protein n=1 Tax=Streptomyces sp. R11 TaxID=3238625 RepID=A0AB39NGJ6_9ACTN